MGTNTRAFNRVLELAQQKLRNTFGMELAELPSRAGLEQENDEEENEARKATGVKKKGSIFLEVFLETLKEIFSFFLSQCCWV